ncbi:MAG: TetR/AcrR family transcriptional regulator [Thermodesulfobacteriota bacterium]
MPKPLRSPEEIEEIRRRILDEALELISREGYTGFSMRKLGKRLGIAAKTVYNYFFNQDEIYLAILTRGFETLYQRCLAAQKDLGDPMDRMLASSREFVEFGLRNPNLYNLMFTWHVPKFHDYVGTDMESVARQELDTALKVADLFMDSIKSCAGGEEALSEEEARFFLVRFWTQAHGFIAGINNSMLNYMHEAPLNLKEPLIENMFEIFKSYIQERQNPEREER